MEHAFEAGFFSQPDSLEMHSGCGPGLECAFPSAPGCSRFPHTLLITVGLHTTHHRAVHKASGPCEDKPHSSTLISLH